MALVVDPQGNEIRALQRVTDWRGKHVLEIGSGNGRVTLRLAALGARKIHALDPDAELIQQARQNLPKLHARRIEYQVAHAEHLMHPSETFDIVLSSWAL
ncbi:MAG TPA: class I SAM-dependent methyltransferase [Anaerolineae bacterium]|nr:class I SAM-dependent methyltransferase [Anaerolineae bacterium]